MAKQRHEKILDAEGAVSDLVSPWVYVGNLEEWSVHVFGNLAGDDYDLEGTNENVGNGSTTAVGGNEIVLESQTADAMLTSDGYEGIAFIRLRYTAGGGGGTVTAWFHGLNAQD